MTIGKRIKLTREKYGMTQVELAKLIGESKQTLYKYENNIIRNIPIDKIELIANALYTTPAFIMGWDEVPKKSVTPVTKEKECPITKIYNSLSKGGQHDLMAYAEYLFAKENK